MILTKIEELAFAKLNKEFPAQAKQWISEYQFERNYVLNEILEEIKGTFKDGTDHGPRHIENVMENAYELLIYNNDFGLDGLHLLCLITCILYHDVGNVFDRKDHQLKVERIYTRVWSAEKAQYRFEDRDAIVKITRAHCGKAQDGTYDTLKELTNNLSYKGKSIKAQELGALLRFSDELAEGQQRTSKFRQAENDYAVESKIYHKYAKSVVVTIDPHHARIALTYSILVKKNSKGKLADKQSLKKLIDFVFQRIEKLDDERQYARHYTKLVGNIKTTSAVLNFIEDNELLPSIPVEMQEIVLTDLKVPGTKKPSIRDNKPDLKTENIISAIQNHI